LVCSFFFISCRFIFGGEHGRFIHRPPDGAAPLYEAMLIKQKVAIEPCFSFGNIERNRLDGPTQFQHHIAFTPQPVRTNHIVFPTHLENVRDRLAENIHELWSMNKVSSGWRFGEVSLIYIIKFLMNIFSIGMIYKKFIHV